VWVGSNSNPGEKQPQLLSVALTDSPRGSPRGSTNKFASPATTPSTTPRGSSSSIHLDSDASPGRPKKYAGTSIQDGGESSPLIHGEDSDKEDSSSSSSSSDDESEGSFKVPGKMGLMTLVFLGYFTVCGGPYGLEVAIGAGYPLLSFLGIFIIPWFWAMPLAIMTAELSTAMPDNDGFILWIKRAWGPFWGYLAGYLSTISGIVDVALYAVLFMAYFYELLKSYIHDSLYFYLIQFGTILGITIVNLTGVDLVGKFSGIFTLLVMAPFFVIFIWTIVKKDYVAKDFLMLPPDLKKVNWPLFINTLVWSYGGYDDVGNIVEELKEPKKQFPRAMTLLIILSIGTYLISIIGTISIDNHYGQWEEGYFAIVAFELGGNALKIVMIVGAMVSNLGQFNALLCVGSQELRALGKKDLIGVRALRWKHPRFRTPWLSIIINAILVSVISLLPFQELVQVETVLYAMVILLEYSALIKLRFAEKDMIRPFVMAKSNLVTILLISPAVLFCGYIIIGTTVSSYLQLGVALGVVVSGMASYALIYCLRRPTIKTVQKKVYTTL